MSHSSEVLIVAGEVSGDIHAGNFLRELKRLAPEIRAFGVGGDELSSAGLECIARTEELSHMGLFEVVKELPRIYALKGRLVDEARRRRPGIAILVDSPDFNLRLAKNLKRLGIRVVLYISPQLWAWRSGRVKTVRNLAHEVLCILPFEVGFYEEHGVAARYVGHPLVDDLDQQGLLPVSGVRRPRKLALLPGSRRMEICRLLPTMLKTLRSLGENIIEDVVLIEAPGVSPGVDAVLEDAEYQDHRIRRIAGPGRRVELASCSLAWTASGTATLECALLDVPMIVGYSLSPVSYALAKRLVRVPHVALVNLIAGARAVPELIQNNWNADVLRETSIGILNGRGTDQQKSLKRVRDCLGDPGASRRTAEAVLQAMGDE